MSSIWIICLQDDLKHEDHVAILEPLHLIVTVIQLMDKILHQLGWTESCKSWMERFYAIYYILCIVNWCRIWSINRIISASLDLHQSLFVPTSMPQDGVLTISSPAILIISHTQEMQPFGPPKVGSMKKTSSLFDVDSCFKPMISWGYQELRKWTFSLFCQVFFGVLGAISNWALSKPTCGDSQPKCNSTSKK